MSQQLLCRLARTAMCAWIAAGMLVSAQGSRPPGKLEPGREVMLYRAVRQSVPDLAFQFGVSDFEDDMEDLEKIAIR